MILIGIMQVIIIRKNNSEPMLENVTKKMAWNNLRNTNTLVDSTKKFLIVANQLLLNLEMAIECSSCMAFNLIADALFTKAQQRILSLLSGKPESRYYTF